MKDIDFLPNRYRERSQLQKLMAWRLAVLSLIAVLIVAVHLTQSSIQRRTSRDLQGIEMAYVEAIAGTSRLHLLQSELAVTEQLAELYAYLKHPWPRTQLLAAVSQTLPTEVRLEEIQISDQAAETPQTQAPNPTASDANARSARQDLEFLRARNQTGTCQVTIRGTTTDISILQSYVAGFSHSAYFTTAKLESLESMDGRGHDGKSHFEIRLEAKPAYWHPGGPVIAEETQGSTDQVAISREVGS